jgi:FkbM family methyltransferase
MKWLKYRLKARALRLSPALYWFVRRWTKGYLEPEIRLLPQLCCAGKLSLDIGANWGAYAYYASQVSKAVRCFEPQPKLAEVLVGSVGRLGNVAVENIAVSDKAGWAEIRVPRNDIGYATIEPGNALEGKADLRLGVETQRVATQRLDDLQLPSVGFIKIDVEGHEYEVLLGARELLKRDTPSLLVETEERHREGALSAVNGFMQELGYRCFVFRNLRLIAAAAPAPASADPCRNLVFLHPRVVEQLPASLFA